MKAVGGRLGEAFILGGGAVLIVCLTLTKWFGVIEPSRHGNASSQAASTQTAVGAWHELGVIPWLLLVVVLVGVLTVATGNAPSRRGRTGIGSAGRLSVALAAAASLVLFYRLLIAPPSAGSVDDIKLGAYLGLISTVALFLGLAIVDRPGGRSYSR